MGDPLSVAGSLVGIISLGIGITKSLVDFYTSVRDQKSDTTSTAAKLGSLLDLLKILERQLTDRTFRPDKPDLLDNIKKSIHTCGESIRKLQAENEKFNDGSTHNISAAARTATRRIIYPFQKDRLEELDKDIDEAVLHLYRVLHILLQDDIELLRADQVSSAIRDWLKAPDASVEYNGADKKRHPDTGLWLVEGSSFSLWLERPNSFLWLNGFAGCGKSVLCSTAIQYAFRHRMFSPRIGIAFFFFVFDNKSKQDASAMLRALVLQLSSQLKDNSPLLQLHHSYRNSMPPDKDLASCLRQLVRMFDHVYIFLDAIDESPRGNHRDGVLQALVDLRAWSEPGLHLLVTSRDEPDIRDTLRDNLNSDIEILSMKNKFIDCDIATFVSQHLRDNRKLKKWKDYHNRIEAVFAERAKGV